MYAVIETGGKQYKVSEGDVIFVEKLEAAEGEKVTFDKVLAVADGDNVTVGQVIGLIKDQKLQFQLWQNGKPVNPQDYIVF